MLKDMALDELRAARAMTQAELGHKLGLKQAAISRMERRTDVYVSTLAKFVEAMGGQLEIRGVSGWDRPNQPVQRCAGGSAKGQVAAAVTACGPATSTGKGRDSRRYSSRPAGAAIRVGGARRQKTALPPAGRRIE